MIILLPQKGLPSHEQLLTFLGDLICIVCPGQIKARVWDRARKEKGGTEGLKEKKKGSRRKRRWSRTT